MGVTRQQLEWDIVGGPGKWLSNSRHHPYNRPITGAIQPNSAGSCSMCEITANDPQVQLA